jgi:hypothetical protein
VTVDAVQESHADLAGPRSSYVLTRSIFLRLLGVVFLFAFLSLWVQIDGLIGSRGILPVKDYLDAARQQIEGAQKYWALPTLLWFDASDAAVHALCAGGVVLSLLLIVGVLPVPVVALLTLDYLSLTVAGQVFLGYQWDALLIETGFLAIFFAPLALTLNARTNPPVPWPMLYMLRWLLFRVMFMSGIVKLASGDPTWRDLTALSYHYWTQPLATWTAWYMAQLPLWVHKFSAVMMFASELPLPLLIFAPWRRVRYIAIISTIGLQLLIGLTGNYGFFNVLTIVLCIPLVDDASWPTRWTRRILRRKRDRVEEAPPPSPQQQQQQQQQRGWRWPLAVSAPIGAALLVLTSIGFLRQVGVEPPQFAIIAYRWAGSLRIANNYGLFAVMTTHRPELIVEGSDDGVTWKPYVFRYKPGPLDRRPAFCTPHMPRLDWQLWFAALDDDYRFDPWFVSFAHRLLENSPPVVALLAENPFPDHPPLLVRAVKYEYRFTDRPTRRATGAWWTRTESGRWFPAVSLKSFGPIE